MTLFLFILDQFWIAVLISYRLKLISILFRSSFSVLGRLGFRCDRKEEPTSSPSLKPSNEKTSVPTNDSSELLSNLPTITQSGKPLQPRRYQRVGSTPANGCTSNNSPGCGEIHCRGTFLESLKDGIISDLFLIFLFVHNRSVVM